MRGQPHGSQNHCNSKSVEHSLPEEFRSETGQYPVNRLDLPGKQWVCTVGSKG